MEKQKYCILCHCHMNTIATGIPSGGYLWSCGSDSNNGLEANGNENEDIQLINSFYRGIEISGFGTGKLDPFLDCGDAGNHGQLSICGACRPVLETTMERKAVLDGADENVRKLQLELLKELNKLKVLVNQFYDNMKGVEERIGSGDQSRYTSGSSWNSCEVDLFERRIRKVVKDLSSCQVNRLQIPENPCLDQDELVGPFSDDIVQPSSPSSEASSQESDDNDNDSSHPSNEDDSPDNQSDQEVTDDSDPDYDGKSTKNQESPKSATTSKNSTNRKPDFNDVRSSYHPCKTYVINKVLLRKERILTGQPLPGKPGAKTDVKDPRDAYYIDYHPTTDSFSLDGIPIILNVTSQKAFNFNCSQCSFITGQRRNPKEKITPFLEILDHFLRLHRKIFQCSFCDKICSGLTRYREHVRGHQLKYVCDICGKPLQTRHTLDQHKWTHMNENEQKQAIKKGAKDPRLLRNIITGETFQCSTCGKGFNRKGNLKLHEKTHQDKEEKRKICDKCGKACFCYVSWLEHWKYCKAGEDVNCQKTIQCTKCTNTFRSVKGLKCHLRRNHPEKGREKEMKCETCGKGYWTMGELKKHLRTHGDERPFECGKGCGMRFKLRGTWRHHEKCCDGSGTRPGPKNGKRKKKVVE